MPTPSETSHAWSQAAVERLRSCFEAGLSASQTAHDLNRALGGGFSRSAVIGKWSRLGLVRGRRPRKAAPATRPAAVASMRGRRRPTLRLAAADGVRLPVEPHFRSSPVQDVPVGLALAPRPWLTRAPGECAFPVDGEGWTLRSCCNPVARGAYCAAHAAVCYRKPKPPAAAATPAFHNIGKRKAEVR